ncbi:MAG: hypothetical protein QOJ29_1629 [Thermoleophilaceae bacterium]|nr:hypothetical protein [Thermoleophilaceae bacterium]
MKALIESHFLKEIGRDRARTTRQRRERSVPDALVIRSAAPADNGSLQRLALLDSAPTPHGPMLVAERQGVLVAAIPFGGGRAIADPFIPSADVVGLLELRRAQLHPAG